MHRADDERVVLRFRAAGEVLRARWRLEGQRLVGRLRGLGATVVDGPPGRLAPALADAYLRVKATGRL